MGERFADVNMVNRVAHGGRWGYGMGRHMLRSTNPATSHSPGLVGGIIPNTVKLYILEWPFIVASLRHTCAIIMRSNQHLDMPHITCEVDGLSRQRRSAH